MLTPVFCYGVVDVPGDFVEDGLRVTVRAYWAVDGLPNIELLSAPAVIAEGQFVPVDLLRGDEGVAVMPLAA